MSVFKFTLLSALAVAAVDTVRADSASLVTSLKTATNEVAKVNLLQDSDYVFDFFNASTGIASGSGGHAVAASVSNFPALVGQGVAMTVGFLEPCGMNTPHTHPRATEILYAVNGTLTSGTIGENGSRFVFNTISPGQATVFPMGSVHYQANEGCAPMTFVSAFNYEDPGTLSMAQRYLGLPPDVVAASLGNLGVEDVVGIEAALPDNFALGRDECLQRCGLTRGPQPSTQRQPRVAGNALPPPAASAASGTPRSSAVSPRTPVRTLTCDDEL
ncbi:hypothetical protein PHLGIDRAFT_115256 [Phlebiopsis gigantea 11061_1 CR5-6]|uniref:Cupin type-1 domain-containing protein n=1 Tax=Phlebiopsis gigantea (strain 11061_1 CR5-6) TaxID=745531 RepID=A0A0C3PT82_PHLG1|nr:hypothetical protein PHLGIDRAFT_115256 [Phlebiopsis gigantea 11061_1 CR5-6]